MPNRLYPLYQLMGLYEELGELGDMEALQRMAKKIIMMQPKIKSPATEAMMDSARNKIEHVNHNIR